MSRPFSVHRFERNTVALAISETTGISLSDIHTTAQFIYIMRHLERARVGTVVVERHYVDRDYLSDYTHFLARSFQAYARFCTRLHFFGRDITAFEFQQAISRGDTEQAAKKLQGSYLGFVVIRPLPQKFIGRTCLRFQPMDGWQTPLLRDYKLGLFGVPLQVRRTVAFQEQDSIVAACATSAVWFALNAGGDHSAIPSPGSITRRAASELADPQRVFPTRGLDSKMMVRALKSEHYEVVVQDFMPSLPAEADNDAGADIQSLKRTIYAYLRGGVAAPIVGVHLYQRLEDGSARSFGRHAVTILGYRLAGSPLAALTSRSKPLRTKADAIESLLAHDDNVGPFCQIEFLGKPEAIIFQERESISTSAMKTPLQEDGFAGIKFAGRKPEDVFLVPSIVALASYHKIRLQLPDISDYLNQLDCYIFSGEQFGSVQKLFGFDNASCFIWDVYVSDSTSVKGEIRDGLDRHGNFQNPEDCRLEALRVASAAWPRYVWRATAYHEPDGAPLFDLIVDATDTLQARSLLLPVFYTDRIRLIFQGLFSFDENADPHWDSRRVSPLVDGLSAYFRPVPAVQVVDADARFGVPTPPRNLKSHEMDGYRVLNQQHLTWTQQDCFVIPHGWPKDVGAPDPAREQERLGDLARFLARIKSDGAFCIWLIDEYCNLVIGLDAPSKAGDPQSPKLGHPTLIGGANARISGELRPPAHRSDSWTLTNASGRYSKLRTDTGFAQLQAAANLVRERCGSVLGNVSSAWGDRHGPMRINEISDIEREVDQLIASSSGDHQERVEDVRDWAEEYLQDAECDKSGVLAGICKIAGDCGSNEKRVLILNFIERLASEWENTGKYISDIRQLVEGRVSELNVRQVPHDDLLLASEREVVARLTLILHRNDAPMTKQLSLAFKWAPTLSRDVIRQIDRCVRG